jgi:hypothetical protein
MRFNFKKIAAIGTSILLAGMSMGFAAAAYPVPFVQSGVASVGIVYGANAPIDLLPVANIQTDLQSYMGSSSGTSATTSGEIYALFSESTNGRLYMNSSINSVHGSLTASQLPNVLADSSFEGNVAADVTQNIKIGPNSRILFGQEPTTDDDPVVYVSLGTTASTYVYNATITFNKAVNMSDADSVGETLTLFGQDFTVGAGTTNTNLYLYKSSQKVTLSLGGTSPTPSTTVTVSDKQYTVTLIGATDTTATISVTDSSGASEQKTVTVDDTKKVQGLDVSVSYAASSTATSSEQATISVGTGKIKLTQSSEVRIDTTEDIVDGTNVDLNTGGWNAVTTFTVQFFAPDTDTNAIIEAGSWTDPVFGGIKLDFAGLVSTARETLKVNPSSDKATVTFTTHTGDGADKSVNWYYNSSAPARLADSTGNNITVLEMGTVYKNGYAVVGNEDDGYLVELKSIINGTTGWADDQVVFRDVFNGKEYSGKATAEGTVGALQIGTSDYVITYNDNKGTEGDEYVRINQPDSTTAATDAVIYPTIETSLGAKVAFYQPVNVSLLAWDGTNTIATLRFPDGDGYTDAGVAYTAGNATEANWTIGGNVISFGPNNAADTVTGNFTIGELKYQVVATDKVINSTFTVYLLNAAGTSKITLPAVVMFEEKDAATSPVYNAEIVEMEGGGTSTNKVGVSDVETTWANDSYAYGTTTWDDIQLESDTDFYKSMDYYGATVLTDRSDADSYSAEISYPDVQVYGLVYVGETGATVTGGTAGSTGSAQLGNVLYKDSEVASASTKNLIIVGGSCVNSAAAALVGGSKCTADWTTATSVGTGQFLIESFGSDKQTLTSKIAVLVAGYEATDTLNAATYLTTQKPDVSVGKKWIGTNSNSATLQATSA